MCSIGEYYHVLLYSQRLLSSATLYCPDILCYDSMLPPINSFINAPMYACVLYVLDMKLYPHCAVSCVVCVCFNADNVSYVFHRKLKSTHLL